MGDRKVNKMRELDVTILQCTFGKSVQRDVGALEKLFLLFGWTKVTQNIWIAH